MIEIRIHGRGGQGAVTLSYMIAIAAFHCGYYTQAFPAFGAERRGAPTQAFVRIGKKKIKLREQIYNPDILVILDDTLLDIPAITKGIKENGKIFVNTKKEIERIGNIPVYTLDASSIALEVLGRNIPNTGMLGFLAALLDFLTLDSCLKAIDEIFSGDIAEKNKELCRRCYERALRKYSYS